MLPFPDDRLHAACSHAEDLKIQLACSMRDVVERNHLAKKQIIDLNMIATINAWAIRSLAIGNQETVFFSPTSFEGDRDDDLRAMWCGSSDETR